MSFFPGKDPAPGDARASDAIEQLIVPRSVDLGGFQVHRALPSARSRMVGPFIFFDHFGPAVFKAGDGVDVRPHPHIGLATVTYLFDGEIVHRDSLGTAMPIRPGAVNWMTAGRGIVHSERTARRPSRRRRAAARPAIMGRAAGQGRRDRAGLRPYRGRRHSRTARGRPDAARRRRRDARPALAGRDKSGTPCSPRRISKPARSCRSTPSMRSAPSMSSPARSKSPATATARNGSWCSGPATAST